jgi:hypothetical protein
MRISGVLVVARGEVIVLLHGGWWGVTAHVGLVVSRSRVWRNVSKPRQLREDAGARGKFASKTGRCGHALYGPVWPCEAGCSCCGEGAGNVSTRTQSSTDGTAKMPGGEWVQKRRQDTMEGIERRGKHETSDRNVGWQQRAEW